MSGGISGAAMVRAANAMLRAFGGDQVSLLLPATAMAGDAAGQLGLVDPGVQQIVIQPVVVHYLPIGNSGPRRRIEFTLPASVLEGQLASVGMGSVQELLDAALGLSYDSEIFHIESVAAESFGGAAYFYVVTAVE